LVLDVGLLTVGHLGGDDDRALHEGLVGVVGPGRRCGEEQERQGRKAQRERSAPHGSMSTFIALPAAIRSSASLTPSRAMRCVSSPWGSSTLLSSSSTARRISSGV